MKYSYLFILLFSMCFFVSCGRKHSIPERDSAKWKEYDYRFYGHTLKHKYPGTDGNNEYDSYKKHIDVKKLQKDEWVIFFGEWYDYYEYPHFEIKMTLVKYKNETAIIPNVDSFTKDIIESLNNPPLQDGKTYQNQKITINGITYLNIVFFDKQKRICREIYVTPLNKYCYLNISADYKESPRGEKGWLASRRKIFKEFAENVRLIKPEGK